MLFWVNEYPEAYSSLPQAPKMGRFKGIVNNF